MQGQMHPSNRNFGRLVSAHVICRVCTQKPQVCQLRCRTSRDKGKPAGVYLPYPNQVAIARHHSTIVTVNPSPFPTFPYLAGPALV